MQPTTVIDTARMPDDTTLVLSARGADFEVSLRGSSLMTSREHHSEERMAEIVCDGLGALPGARLLVGGLGMGYTLRAALDRLRADATVVVVELLEAIVRWNRGPLSHLAGDPLEDARTRTVTTDLVDYLDGCDEAFDGILVDVDNGPEPFTTAGNARLYDARGLARLHTALKKGATMALWSAFESPGFERGLRRAGFEVRVVRTRSRGRKGAHHVLFVGRRIG